MQTPAFKSVEIEKNGRFWAVSVDGEMLAIVLYKRGALAIQEMVCRLSGLPLPKAKATKSEKAPQSAAKPSSNPAEPKARSKKNQPKAKKPAQPKSAKKS